MAVRVAGRRGHEAGGRKREHAVLDSLYLSPVAWVALAAIALARLNLEYFLICVVATVLGAANVVGYTKCSKDAQANISNFARTTLVNSVVHRFV